MGDGNCNCNCGEGVYKDILEKYSKDKDNLIKI